MRRLLSGADAAAPAPVKPTAAALSCIHLRLDGFNMSLKIEKTALKHNGHCRCRLGNQYQ
jgi:hypothetical protein